MTRPSEDKAGRVNKLLRTTGPVTYRLMAVQFDDGPMYGEQAEGNSLAEDIAALRSKGLRPLYSVFVRPKHNPTPPLAA